MKNLGFRWNMLAIAFLTLLFTGLANAQATRTWVSGVGDDANPCSRTAPCKTFAGAISKTADGGEIDCLDPGGFGAVTITKSITIDCDSGAGGVLSSGVQGIVINTTTSNFGNIVILRNLTISGAGTTIGTNGINVVAAKMVGLEDVVINQYSNTCLTISAASPVFVYADDSKFVDCGNAGISAGQNAKVTVTRSLISMTGPFSNLGGAGQGISQSGSGSQVLITGSTVMNTGTAFQSSAGNFLGVSGVTVTNNGVIFNQNGGQIFTGSDNPSFGNGPTGATTGAVPKN